MAPSSVFTTGKREGSVPIRIQEIRIRTVLWKRKPPDTIRLNRVDDCPGAQKPLKLSASG